MKCNEFLKTSEHYVWNADKFDKVFKYSSNVSSDKDYHITNNPIDGTLSGLTKTNYKVR